MGKSVWDVLTDAFSSSWRDWRKGRAKQTVMQDQTVIKEDVGSWLQALQNFLGIYDDIYGPLDSDDAEYQRLRRLFTRCLEAWRKDDVDGVLDQVDAVQDAVRQLEDYGGTVHKLLRAKVRDEDFIEAAKSWDEDIVGAAQCEDYLPQLVLNDVPVDYAHEIVEIDAEHNCDPDELRHLAVHEVDADVIRTLCENDLLRDGAAKAVLRYLGRCPSKLRDLVEALDGQVSGWQQRMHAREFLGVIGAYDADSAVLALLPQAIDEHPILLRYAEDLPHLTESALTCLLGRDPSQRFVQAILDDHSSDWEALEELFSSIDMMEQSFRLLIVSDADVDDVQLWREAFGGERFEAFLEAVQSLDLSVTDQKEALASVVATLREQKRRLGSIVNPNFSYQEDFIGTTALFKRLQVLDDATTVLFFSHYDAFVDVARRGLFMTAQEWTGWSAGRLQVKMVDSVLRSDYDVPVHEAYRLYLANTSKRQYESLRDTDLFLDLPVSYETRLYGEVPDVFEALASLPLINSSVDTLNWLSHQYDWETFEQMTLLLQDNEVLGQLSAERRGEALECLLKYCRASQGLQTKKRTENTLRLWNDYVARVKQTGGDFDAIELRAMIEHLYANDIVGSITQSDLVFVGEDTGKISDVYRVEKVTADGYVVRNVKSEERRDQPVTASRLVEYEEDEEWYRIENLREKGFLTVHSCNAYRGAQRVFENLKSDLTTNEKYSFSCSTIHEDYPCGIAITGEYSIGVVLDRGKIYAAWSEDAYTKTDGTQYYREGEAPVQPIPVAVTSDKRYNEVLPQKWTVDAVYFTAGTPHPTPDEKKTRLARELQDLLRKGDISAELDVYAIDTGSNRWEQLGGVVEWTKQALEA